MKLLIACEESQAVCKAFRARGHEAYSCDIIEYSPESPPRWQSNGGDMMKIAKNKLILDATCGSRTIWFEKNCPYTLYMDKREEHDLAIWKSTKNDSVRTLDVEPDIIADFTDMPFEDDSFYLVVFDPPHLIQIGDNAWMKKKYGKLDENWRQMIHDGFWECMRVLRPCGTLIFKWSEIQIPTREVINAIGKDPLFGHRSGKKMNTHWLCYMKFPE